jgi:hypothetical protein
MEPEYFENEAENVEEDMNYEDEVERNGYDDEEMQPGSPLGIKIVNTVSLSAEFGNPDYSYAENEEVEDENESQSQYLSCESGSQYDDYQNEDDEDEEFLDAPVINSRFDDDNDVPMFKITSVTGGHEWNGVESPSDQTVVSEPDEIVPVDNNAILGI